MRDVVYFPSSNHTGQRRGYTSGMGTLFKGTIELTKPIIVKGFDAEPVHCGSGTPDDIEATKTGGTVGRYDDAAGQFVQNWQTIKNQAPLWCGGDNCRRLFDPHHPLPA